MHHCCYVQDVGLMQKLQYDCVYLQSCCRLYDQASMLHILNDLHDCVGIHDG
jgi:hypothetical protein